ncbi:hypothetical protein PVAP13_4NG046054 [Panicum virgatum]|uniref:Uncharacterized protein n=1 Tax=Panicum virgatum TaxID=38727 RepID=A0A8T0TAB5_PANVG|nr:hypothetical protein PVAP13_4NG046054 [Panicum virgatum]
MAAPKSLPPAALCLLPELPPWLAGPPPHLAPLPTTRVPPRPSGAMGWWRWGSLRALGMRRLRRVEVPCLTPWGEVVPAGGPLPHYVGGGNSGGWSSPASRRGGRRLRRVELFAPGRGGHIWRDELPASRRKASQPRPICRRRTPIRSREDRIRWRDDRIRADERLSPPDSTCLAAASCPPRARPPSRAAQRSAAAPASPPRADLRRRARPTWASVVPKPRLACLAAAPAWLVSAAGPPPQRCPLLPPSAALRVARLP